MLIKNGHIKILNLNGFFNFHWIYKLLLLLIFLNLLCVIFGAPEKTKQYNFNFHNNSLIVKWCIN